MTYNYNPYSLPTINFIGGSTQKFVFNVYFYNGKKPFNMSGCECIFSIVSFTNKTGSAIISKKMEIANNIQTGTENVLTVTLDSSDTVDLFGKYIYQITICDVDDIVEIPQQGILYITNNIDKQILKSTK